MVNAKTIMDAKVGDLLGFNIHCTAPNGFEEHYSVRFADSGTTKAMDDLLVVRGTFERMGWNVKTVQVFMTAETWDRLRAPEREERKTKSDRRRDLWLAPLQLALL